MIKVNSKKEIRALGEVWWEESKRIRISGYGIFYLKDDNYPKYFKCVESDDLHFCDTYHECTEKAYEKWRQAEIRKLTKKIEKLQKTS